MNLAPVRRLARRNVAGARLLLRVVASVRRRLAQTVWPIAKRYPAVPVPAVVLLPFAHESSGRQLLEELAAWAATRRRRGSRGIRLRLLHEQALVQRGRLAYHGREPGDGLPWFEQAHREAGPTARTCTWIGAAQRRHGRLIEAREFGEQALKINAGWRPALVHLGNLNYQLGDRAASVECWRRLIGDDGATVYELSRAWIGLERVRELDLALEAAERLVEATGSGPIARATRAVTQWERGQRADAEASLHDLADNDDPASIEGFAWYLGRTRRSADAYALLDDLEPPVLRSDMLVELYHMLRRDGHLRLALEVARRGVALFGDQHAIHTVEATAVGGEVRVFAGEWAPPRRSAPSFIPARGRVLHVVGKTVPYAHTGYCVRTDHTVRAQRALGVDVHVASQLGFPYEQGVDAPAHEVVAGVGHHRLPIPDGTLLPLTLDTRLDLHVDALSGVVEQLRPAVLHAASDFRNALVALAVGERYDLPVVYEMRGFWEETWLAKREGDGADADAYVLRQQRELESAQRAARVVTLASTMRDVLIERGVAPDKISLAPNAVDPADFGPVDRDDDLAKRFGIKPGQVVAGYISSFVGYEGINVLIDAVAKARAGGVDMACLLVGDGLVRPELERQAERLGIADDVVFTGRVPHSDVRSYYELIDIFVVPRTNARVCQLVSPLKPFEAMAASRPLVMSGTPVLRSLITEGVTGVTFVPEDADDLASRLIELAADPRRRAELGDAARVHVLEHHTWQRNAERYQQVYEQVGAL